MHFTDLIVRSELADFHAFDFLRITKFPISTSEIRVSTLNHSQLRRPSVTRTLMARLPRLVQTRSSVPWYKFNSGRSGIISGDFLFYFYNGILCAQRNIN